MKQRRANHRLLRLLGKPEEDWPSHQEPHFCCFKRDLESTLRSEIGEAVFEGLLNTCQETFGIPKRKHAIKNPTVISAIISEAKKQGKSCATLEKIVSDILTLARK